MKTKEELIEYLTDMLTGDPSKFIEFMGYDDIGRDIISSELNAMNDEELDNTVKWFSDDYNDREDFEASD